MNLWLATYTPLSSQEMYIRSLGKGCSIYMRMFYKGNLSYKADLFQERGKLLKRRQ